MLNVNLKNDICYRVMNAQIYILLPVISSQWALLYFGNEVELTGPYKINKLYLTLLHSHKIAIKYFYLNIVKLNNL